MCTIDRLKADSGRGALRYLNEYVESLAHKDGSAVVVVYD